MLIILEGPDCSGKTTIAERIRELTGANLLHKGPPARDVISEYTLDLQWYRPGQGVDIICDRWHLGEQVYGPILRGESGFDRASFAHVEKTLQVRGALLGVPVVPTKMLKTRMSERGDDLVDPGELRKIQAAYGNVLRTSGLARLGVDGTGSADFVAGLLVSAARHLEEQYASLQKYRTYVGDRNPRWLLLGDVRNGEDPEEEAAFTPAPGTSGRFLLEHLPERVLRNCGIANACEEDVMGLWELLGRPKTVALGVNAALACQVAQIRYGVVPHPQFVRRFLHSSGAEYGALIRDTLISGEDQIRWRP